MREYVTYDRSEYPIVKCIINNFDPTVQEFEAHQKEESEIIQQQGIVEIYDFTNLKLLSAELRIKQGKWIEKNKEILKKNVLGIAFYCPTIWGGMVLKAIFIISKPIVDYVVVNKLEDAYTYARAKIASNNSLEPRNG
jgi:hypothetical protein